MQDDSVFILTMKLVFFKQFDRLPAPKMLSLPKLFRMRYNIPIGQRLLFYYPCDSLFTLSSLRPLLYGNSFISRMSEHCCFPLISQQVVSHRDVGILSETRSERIFEPCTLLVLTSPNEAMRLSLLTIPEKLSEKHSTSGMIPTDF